MICLAMSPLFTLGHFVRPTYITYSNIGLIIRPMLLLFIFDNRPSTELVHKIYISIRHFFDYTIASLCTQSLMYVRISMHMMLFLSCIR